MRLPQIMICLVALGTRTLPGSEYEATLDPLVRVVDLHLGEISEVRLSDGNTVDVELISVDERRDTLRQAVREASVIVRVNGRTVRLVSATYHLPREIAGVQIDCPVTKGYAGDSSEANVWPRTGMPLRIIALLTTAITWCRSRRPIHRAIRRWGDCTYTWHPQRIDRVVLQRASGPPTEILARGSRPLVECQSGG